MWTVVDFFGCKGKKEMGVFDKNICLKLLTSVTTAHIIITNVNRSEYVTIGIIPLHRLGVDATVPRLPY